jgi:hypothetical protein
MSYVPDGATKVLDVGAPLETVRYRRELLDSTSRGEAHGVVCAGS